MDFGEALQLLKQGKRVCRKGWNGKNMFIYLVNGTTIDRSKLYRDADMHIPNVKDKVEMGGHIDMFAADGSVVIGWLASQSDMLAEDWEIAE